MPPPRLELITLAEAAFTFDEPSVAKATQSLDVVRFWLLLLLLLLLLLRPKSLFLGRNCSAQDHSWG